MCHVKLLSPPAAPLHDLLQSAHSESLLPSGGGGCSEEKEGAGCWARGSAHFAAHLLFRRNSQHAAGKVFKAPTLSSGSRQPKRGAPRAPFRFPAPPTACSPIWLPAFLPRACHLTPPLPPSTSLQRAREVGRSVQTRGAAWRGAGGQMRRAASLPPRRGQATWSE